jgi:putative oxidoreductase
MAIDRTRLDALTPRALALLRIVTGFLFLQHGSAKLLGIPHVEMFDQLQVMSLVGFAGVLELVGGALLVLGLWTRPVALVLSGEKAVAYLKGQAPQGQVLSPKINQGEPAVLYCFIFLFLSAAGAGAWSVDNRGDVSPA